MLAAVKIMCSSLLFGYEGLKYHVFAIEQLQRAAYAATNKAPIYEGLNQTEINMEWVMKCLDFFRYHMMNTETVTLGDAMEDLSVLQKPTAWQQSLKNGTVPLSRHWKGTYSFLDPNEQRKLRCLSDDDDSDVYFSDKNIDEGKIQVRRGRCTSSSHGSLTWLVSRAQLRSRTPTKVAEIVRRTPELTARG